jgi:hypothetical protein
MEEDMKMKIVLIAMVIIGLACWNASAQEQPKSSKTPRITHRQIKQQARIKHGVQSGELTKPEILRLEKEQAKIQHDKKEAKSDGKVTPTERRHIKKEQNKASRDIKRLKNNNRTVK